MIKILVLIALSLSLSCSKENGSDSVAGSKTGSKTGSETETETGSGPGSESAKQSSIEKYSPTLWFKADAITGVSDGDDIEQWSDSSSASSNATQEVADSMPHFKADAINGLPSVEFDGVDDLFDLPAASGHATGAISSGMTLIAVAKQLDNTGYQTLLGFGSMGDRPFLGLSEGKSMYFHQNLVPASRENSNTVTAGTFHILSLVQSESSVYFYNDGGADELSDRTFNIGENIINNDTRTIGGDRDVNDNLYLEFFDGEISEIVFYDKALSDEQRVEVQCELAEKYAITVTGC